ncbi:MAG: hypothetical protein IPL65_15510 [Lewinellaceae bacterium]|nr:hypothetical protein [Lewinellaceae bacterium]
MDDLRELTGIVTPKKLEALRRRYGAYLPRDPRVKRLYDLLVAGKLRTDAEAMQAILGSNKHVLKFRRIKIALREYLHQMLLIIDLNLPHYHQRQTAYYEAYKQWAALKLLTGKGAHIASMDVAKSTLKLARKYEFTDIAVDIARSFRLYYGSLVGDIKQFDHYVKLTRTYEDIFHFENLAEELYTDLVIRYVNTKSTQTEVHTQAKASFKRLEPALRKYDTYRLHFVGRLMEVLIYTSINDYKSTVGICDKAIRFFEQKPYIASIPLQVFLYQEMVCYVQLRDFKRGEAAAARGMQFIEEGSFNWFKYQELFLLLSLHARQYKRAYDTYLETVAHRRFATLPDSIRQIWKIMEAYLYFLIETGKIVPAKPDARFSRFRVVRFVNEVPLFSKDKRGMNIPILIFQILYLLQEKKYGEMLDRMEAISKYSSRYLKKKDNYRSSCFIKMLLQIPASDFHRVAVERHAGKYAALLAKAPIDFAGQSHDIEIIPYEDLWEMVLGLL